VDDQVHVTFVNDLFLKISYDPIYQTIREMRPAEQLGPHHEDPTELGLGIALKKLEAHI
jgi:hypothetical protein